MFRSQDSDVEWLPDSEIEWLPDPDVVLVKEKIVRKNQARNLIRSNRQTSARPARSNRQSATRPARFNRQSATRPGASNRQRVSVPTLEINDDDDVVEVSPSQPLDLRSRGQEGGQSYQQPLSQPNPLNVSLGSDSTNYSTFITSYFHSFRSATRQQILSPQVSMQLGVPAQVNITNNNPRVNWLGSGSLNILLRPPQAHQNIALGANAGSSNERFEIQERCNVTPINLIILLFFVDC